MTFCTLFLIAYAGAWIWKKWINPQPTPEQYENELHEKLEKLEILRDKMKNKKEEVSATLNLKAVEEEIQHLEKEIEVIENS
jgi:DNA repair exonuclease SbcCD ATPase subunit